MTDPEITRWLAEKVMGYDVVLRAEWHRDPRKGVIVDCGEIGMYFAESIYAATQQWSPPTSISDAMECLDKWTLTDRKRESVLGYENLVWRVRLYRRDGFLRTLGTSASSRSRECAICLALVRATGGTI